MENVEKRVESFRQYLVEEEKSTATIEKYMRDIRTFLKWASSGELNKMLVLRYKEYLTANYAPASANSMLSSINSFFEFNEWHGLKVKMFKIQRQIFAERSKELTKEEYQRLLDAANKKNNKTLYYLMQTICSSGIRVSELQSITVEAAREQQATIRCKGKMRVVILPEKLCRMLLKYAGESMDGLLEMS